MKKKVYVKPEVKFISFEEAKKAGHKYDEALSLCEGIGEQMVEADGCEKRKN